MTDSKTDKIKNQTRETAEFAEHGVETGVDRVEKSRVGQAIPTYIEKVHFRDIVYGTLGLSVILTIPLYLIICDELSAAEPKYKVFKQCVKYILLFAGLVASIFDLAVIMLHMERFWIATLLFRALKVIAVLISIFIINIDGMFPKGLFVVYSVLGVLFIDFLFVYYGVLYFKRTNSDAYDEMGDRKQEKSTERKEEMTHAV